MALKYYQEAVWGVLVKNELLEFLRKTHLDYRYIDIGGGIHVYNLSLLPVRRINPPNTEEATFTTKILADLRNLSRKRWKP